MEVGNFLGLPVNFIVFAIITVIVTAGTLKVFGEAIMDPVRIVERIGNPWIVALGSSPSSSRRWASTSSPTSCRRPTTSPTSTPQKINFRLGGLITSILSVLVCPWLFVSSPQAITHLRLHLRRGARPDVRNHHGRLLPGEAAGRTAGRPLLDVADRFAASIAAAGTPAALAALGMPGFVSIGLALLGAYGVILNVGDWGWLIGAALARSSISPRPRRSEEPPSPSRPCGVSAVASANRARS